VILVLTGGVLPRLFSQRTTERVPAVDLPVAKTVCELLDGAALYRGTTVIVTGIVWFGLRDNCPKALITGGHHWPSAINLADSDYARHGDRKGVTFETDRKSWDLLDGTLRAVAGKARRAEVWITVSGEFEAPVSYIRKDGKVVGGYGHLGVYPAELIVRRILDISVRDRPTYDYRDLFRSAKSRSRR
jgi:hypothetical protein